ncbi:hypothetical protein IAE33_004038 [Pseudomonas sp. S60]|uniref:hypothetical protein n=1 Tax=Pseudomonas sp. S60 TaxID=211124 RepID=UPI0019149934|nr:hypothetical protein [Pseudomonas sp. S60]MBK5012178.1 hypothetical protein [Pseudomonas sp. S60]
MPRPRELRITLRPLPLILSVAVGLWLGAGAIALSIWAASFIWPEPPRPLDEAATTSAPHTAPPPAAADDSQARMFEQYKKGLQKQAAEAAQGDPRNLDSPKCQFWLQQNRTAPTDKSQANVLEFCY